MRNYCKYLFSFCLLCFAVVAFGQNDCERKLEKARVLFEKGYLEDIPGLLEPCINENQSLSWSNRNSALQILTETFLFIGDKEKADKYFVLLLKNNPSYEPKLRADHPELVYLADKFSIKPKVTIGVKLGYIFPSVENRKTYFLEDSLSSATDKYGSYISLNNSGISKFQFGVSGDFTLNHSNFVLSTEVLLTEMAYQLNTDMQFIESNYEGTLSLEEHLKFVDFGLNLKYNLKAFPIGGQPKHYNSRIKAIPYFSLGFALNLLYKARMENLDFTKFDSNGNIFIEKEQSTGLDLLEGSSPLRNNFNFSATANAGLKIILGDNYYGILDFRYSKMLNSIVVSDNRFSNDVLLQKFRHVDNDISLNSFVISIGIGFTLSRSIKKIH